MSMNTDFIFPDEISITEPPKAAIENTDIWIQGQEDSKVAGVTNNLDAASEYSVQDVVRARDISRQYGIDIGSSLRDLKFLEKAAQRMDPATVRNLHPAMLNTLMDAHKAGMARQDLENFNAVAETLDGINDGLTDYAVDISSDDLESILAAAEIQKGARRAAIMTAPEQIPLRDRLELRTEEGAGQVGTALRGSLLMVAEPWIQEISKHTDAGTLTPEMEFLRDAVLNPMISDLRSAKEKEALSALPMLPRAQNKFQAYLEDVVSIAPQIAAQVGVTLMASPAAGMAFMGAQIAGQEYGELTDKGVDFERAAFASLVNAGVQAPLEQIGIGKALNIFKTSGAWNIVKAVGGATLTEAVTEFIQQYPDEISRIWAEETQKGGSAEDVLGRVWNELGEMTKEGLYQGLVAAPFGAFLGGAHAITGGLQAKKENDAVRSAMEQRAQEAQQEIANATMAVVEDVRKNEAALSLSQGLQDAGARIDAMKLQQMSPDAAESVIADLLKNITGIDGQMWLSAEDVVGAYNYAAQTGAEQSVLAALDIDYNILRATAEMGGFLPVQAAALLTRTTGEARSALAQRVRTTPDGVSAAEAELFDPVAVVERSLGIAMQEGEQRARVGKERQRLIKEMQTAGVAPHVAEAYATLNTAQVLAFQKVYGVDAGAALARRSVARDMGGSGLGASLSLRQAGETFQRPDAVGRITPEIAAALQLNKPGEVVLDKEGIAHIEERHGKDLRTAGFVDVQELVSYVAENIDAVYQGNTGRKYELVAHSRNPNAWVIVRLEFSEGGDYYRVVTASVKDSARYKNKTPLWENAHISQSDNEPRGDTPRTVGKSGVSGENITPPKAEGNILSQSNRGRVEFSGTGADEVARIFLSPDADLSTIPHESAHIFLRELEAVAADTDNAVQRQALARQLVENGVAPDALQGVVDGTVSVDEARKLMANLMRELEYAEQNISLVKDVRAQRQKQTNTAQQQGAISPV